MTTPAQAADRRPWLMRIPMKYIAIFGGAITLLASLPFLILWYGEHQREKLISSYNVPADFLSDVLTKGSGSTSVLMDKNETLICALGGYGSVEDLPGLSKQQKESLPKDKLPSEDLAWYLLFFSHEGVSRVHLIDNEKLEGSVEGGGPGCVDREGHFRILKLRRSNAENYFALKLIK